jgi:gliding motility-associated-like protein
MIEPQLPASAVTPAAVTVTANTKSKAYGTLLAGGPGSSEFIVNGLQNDETAQTVTIAYQAGSAAADPVQLYPLAVKPMGLTGGTFDPKNYTITYFNADLTVTKVLLEITADNKTKVYKDPNPGLTITYKSFVNGETVAQLTTPPVISTTADATSLPGTYPINVTGATSPNYDIKLNNGVLTVRPLVLALKIPNTFTPNGDGINDTWNIVNIEAYPDCTVNIFNRWGQKVYASVGYAKSWDGLYNNAPLPVSTYYYIIDLKNGTKAYSGDITIIR